MNRDLGRCSHRASVLSALLLATALAHADGGAVRLRGDAGPYAVTLFSPEPLRAGAADLSVLVQSWADDSVELDAEVELELRGPDGATATRVRATREAATNKLLRAAMVDLPRPGTWQVAVWVAHAGGRERIAGKLHVGPPPPALLALWPYLALPAALIALFALRQRLASRRR
jgi:hypothetical protein